MPSQYQSHTVFLLEGLPFWRARVTYWTASEAEWKRHGDTEQAKRSRKARMCALRALRSTYAYLRQDVAKTTTYDMKVSR